MKRDHLYAQHADTIESVLAYTRRAQRLTADAGDEFASWARLKLLEDDCAILGKYQGLSTFRTYLVTVIQRLFLDWRIAEWGRWRPTTDARRAGPLAIELEKLVLRDRVDFEQAAQTLVSKGIAASAAECDRVWAELPRRPRRQRAGADELERVAASTAARDPITQDEDQAGAARARAALADALPKLEAQEQLIIRLRYQDGFTVARIAQLLNVEAKPLYRRIEQLLSKIRGMLLDAGVTAEDARGLFGNPALEPAPIFPETDSGKPELGPSNPSTARRPA